MITISYLELCGSGGRSESRQQQFLHLGWEFRDSPIRPVYGKTPSAHTHRRMTGQLGEQGAGANLSGITPKILSSKESIMHIVFDMLVTTPESHPGFLPYHPTAIFPAPFEGIGCLFTSELDDLKKPLCRELPQAIQSIKSGKCEAYEGGDGFYDITIRGGIVSIECDHLDPLLVCQVEMLAFEKCLSRWLLYLSHLHDIDHSTNRTNRN